MNTSTLPDNVDWKAAGEAGLTALAQARVDERQAAQDFAARSDVWKAWSLAVGIVFGAFLLCSDKAAAESIALCLLISGCIVSGALSFQARQRRDRSHEETLDVADELAHRFPRQTGPEQPPRGA